jgi:hypothetical protein
MPSRRRFLTLLMAAGPALAACVEPVAPDLDQGDRTAPPAAVGDLVILPGGAWTLRVLDVLQNTSLSFGVMNRPARAVFVSVTLAISNAGRVSAALDASPFRLIDSGGREHRVAHALRFFGERLESGRTANGKLIFDVPVDAGDLLLTGGRGYRVALGPLAAIPHGRIQAQE